MNRLEKTIRRAAYILLSIGITISISSCASNKESNDKGYIVIQEQGSFAIGGTVTTAPGTFDPIADGAFNPSNQNSEGQTLHGDHAFVIYQKTVDAHKLPLVF